MKENVLEVLMYLFENFYLDDESEITPDHDTLQGKLQEAGFMDNEISKALDWLAALSEMQSQQVITGHTNHALRIYTSQESNKLDADCRGFLLFLEQSGILTPVSREVVIERLMALESEEIDIDQVKWVVLMVLFSQPGEEAAYAWMEDLVFDNPIGYLH